MSSSHLSKKGFTLIEIVLAVFVFTIIGVAIFMFGRGIVRNSSLFQTSITSKNQVRKLFKDFTEEVRSATYAWNGTHVIEIASSTSFAFYANIDEDKYSERINYYLSGDKLMKQTNKYDLVSNKYDIGTTSAVVLKDVYYSTSSPIFRYYDANYDGTDVYAELAQPVDISVIRLVSIRVINGQYGKRISASDTNEVKVSVRNLKDNY